LSGVQLSWVSGNGSINTGGFVLLRYTRSSGSGLVFWTGNQMLLVADSAAGVPQSGATAVTAVTDPRRDRPGRSGAMNSSNEVCFRVSSDSSQWIYFAVAQ
jgi:hypothetical protein